MSSSHSASRSASPSDAPRDTKMQEAAAKQKEAERDAEAADDSGSEFEEGSEGDDAEDAASDPETGAGSSAAPTGAADDTTDAGATPSASTADAKAATSGAAPASQTAWQAIWSPAHNAYYFFNSQTQETTWVNPLEPSANASTSAAGADPEPESSSAADPSAASSSTTATTTQQPDVPAHLRSLYQAQAAAEAAGIDPSLAFLDPSLAVPGGAPIGGYAASARFNARTGAFAKTDARDPTHLSEYARMQRMSQFYFDTTQWEKDVEKRKAEEAAEEEEGRRKKKPSKADLERFKEQKRQRKLAKTAWLRN